MPRIWNITEVFDQIVYIAPQERTRASGGRISPKNAAGFALDRWDADIIDKLSEEVADEPETGLTDIQITTLIFRAAQEKETTANWGGGFSQMLEEGGRRIIIMETKSVLRSSEGEPLFLGLPVPGDEDMLTGPTAAEALTSLGFEVHRLGWINLVGEGT